ncbi:hypothetical protein [Streptomyces sp. NPDC055886]
MNDLKIADAIVSDLAALAGSARRQGHGVYGWATWEFMFGTWRQRFTSRPCGS